MYIPFAFEGAGSQIENYFTIEYLVVGGGGCGGKSLGGGGGAGGYVTGSNLFTSSLNPSLTGSLIYPVLVGTGGVTSSVVASGGDGGSSSFYDITALGGGGGGGRSGSFTGSLTGRDGGSAGGGGFTSPTLRPGGNATQPGSVWSGFGNNGGYGFENPGQDGGAGGGGGAAGAGGDANTGDFINYNPGPGGSGKVWLDGITYAGGGGGAGDSVGGAGGAGGGGTGGKVRIPASNPTRGTDGLGGGGGGGASTFEPTIGRGEGGSGVVRLRYPTNGNYIVSGGTITQSGGYTYHTFLSSSNFVINGVAPIPPGPSGSVIPTGSIAVSSSLAVLYDTNYTQSYDGTGSTIYNLASTSNNATLVTSSAWLYDSSSLATKTLKLLTTGSSGDGSLITIPSITVSGSYSLLISMYGSNTYYTGPNNTIPLFQTNTKNLVNDDTNGLRNGANILIRSMISPINSDVTIGTPVNNSWQIYQVSYNGVTDVVNYAVNGVTGSYSPAAFDFNNRNLQFNIFGASGDFGSGFGGYGSGTMMQVAAIYTASLSNDEMIQNWNAIKGRYGY